MELIKEIIPDLLVKLTVAGDVIIALGLLYLGLTPIRKIKFIQQIVEYFQSKAVIWSGVIALIATSGSLFYSDVLGYNPCKLCWYQRIFMYPIVLLALVGLIKKDEKVMSYIVPMASFGAVVAFYHYLMQRGAVPVGDCGVVGYSESCASTFFLEYGYITIPMMALTAFLLIIGLGILKSQKKD